LNSPVSSKFLLIAADIVLLLHVLIVIFVVAGLIAIVVGGFRDWRWVRSPWFRWAHLLAIAVVTTQAWLGVICPLTTMEMALRSEAGGAVYSGSFIGHWLQTLLYYQAPPWLFIGAYSLFACLVLTCWFLVRPRPFGENSR